MFIKQSDEIESIINKLNNSNENELCIDWHMYTSEAIEKLKAIFLNVASLNKNTTILIRLSKVCDFDLLDISQYKGMGLNFKIVLDGSNYTYDEFNSLNNKLNNYIKSIVDDNMSPYEKYSSIYNFVRKFKEYKIIDQSDVQDLSQLLNNKNQSCNLKYILENDYMDCRGFSILLQTLLNKVNIEAIDFALSVNNSDGSYLGGHSRTLINLDDDKYNIHGIFISDPTWESKGLDDELQFSLLPTSSMRDPIYQKCNTMLLFDATSDEEFDANFQELCIKIKNESVKQELLEMIYSIDRNKSMSLSKIEDETEFYLEIKDYVLSKNNSLTSEIKSEPKR